MLTAVIVLAYALSRFLDLPVRAGNVQVGGPLLIQLLVAALISTGADALIRSHPRFTGRTTLIHWIVPGAAALVLGAGLERLPNGPAWWLGMAASALGLILILVAEFIVVDAQDLNRDPAALLLNLLVYALAIVLFALLHNLSTQPLIAAGIGGLVAAGLAWRLFALNGAAPARAALYAGVIGLICAEVVWAVSYWRITSSGAALLAMLSFYLGVGICQQQLAGRLARRVWVEYGLVGLAGLGIVLIYVLR